MEGEVGEPKNDGDGNKPRCAKSHVLYRAQILRCNMFTKRNNFVDFLDKVIADF